jgi:plastocyanin
LFYKKKTMKTILLFCILTLLSATGLKSQITHAVNESGFAYDPAVLNISVGDNVQFNGTATHPIVQVSEATWSENGSTPLEGGFSFAEGTGTVAFNEAGTFYYVCTAHVASNGMKGQIVVSVPTALDEVSSAGKYTVYPVPLTGNELTIAPEKSGQNRIAVTIYDIAGNLRITSSGATVDGKYKVDCSNLPHGLFLMKLEAGNEVTYSKIIRN